VAMKQHRPVLDDEYGNGEVAGDFLGQSADHKPAPYWSLRSDGAR
jgi:hypothetical protein